MFLREWKFFYKMPIFWIVLAVSWLSLGLGGWNGYKRWSSQVTQARLLNQQFEDVLARRQERLGQIEQAFAAGHPETIREAELIWGVTQPQYIDANAAPISVLPAAPLGFLATGRSDTLPRSYTSSTFRGLEPNAPTTDDPVSLLIGDFDLKSVVLAILPLILVLSCFDLLATEREDGTLRLLLSQPTSFRRLLLYRAAVRGALVGVSLLVTVIILAFAVYLASGFIWTGRLAVYTAVSEAYLASWLLAAVGVNLLGRSGTSNSLLLGGAWAIMVIFLPGMTPVLVEAISPTPSRALYIDLARAARLEFYNAAPDEQGRQLQRRTMLAAFFKRHPEWSAPSLHQQSLYQASQGEEFSLEVDKITEQFDAARERQDKVSTWISAFSVTATVDQILTGVSGNSDARQSAFLRQSLSFFSRQKQYFWPRIFRQEVFKTSQFVEIPRFAFTEPSTQEVFRPLLPLCLVFGAWWASLAIITLRQLRRKPIL
jgi:ABC-2 type transport system permease protein